MGTPVLDGVCVGIGVFQQLKAIFKRSQILLKLCRIVICVLVFNAGDSTVETVLSKTSGVAFLIREFSNTDLVGLFSFLRLYGLYGSYICRGLVCQVLRFFFNARALSNNRMGLRAIEFHGVRRAMSHFSWKSLYVY